MVHNLPRYDLPTDLDTVRAQDGAAMSTNTLKSGDTVSAAAAGVNVDRIDLKRHQLSGQDGDHRSTGSGAGPASVSSARARSTGTTVRMPPCM